MNYGCSGKEKNKKNFDEETTAAFKQLPDFY